jgi:hypothetical protein
MALLVSFPLFLAVWVLGIWDWDLSIPLIYRNADDIWQLTLTKVLYETGWVLNNPYLGAPEVAHWQHNAAAQTSALHSVLMLVISPFTHDSVRLQQVYYLLNFPLIAITSFIACRLFGVARLPALCVGLLFAFTTFRIDEMLYSFLTNYFMVPLALVAVIWVLSGRFYTLLDKYEGTDGLLPTVVYLFRSHEFLLGLLFVILMATSDGYYAFFTLLLLGFSVFARLLLADWRRPLSFLPSIVFITAILVVSLLLQVPLQQFKKSHLNEFYPGGVEDSALTKHPFEAEVYSSSLKLLIAPIRQHRIEPLGRFGNWMVETSDGARLFKNGRNLVPLGSLGTLLFFMALTFLAIPGLREFVNSRKNVSEGSVSSSIAMGNSLLSLTLFIFLGSIVGGIGTLVALIFPTIRSYDRFPLFLLFVLYLGFALGITKQLMTASRAGRVVWISILIFVTAAALYDQIPRNARKGDEISKAQFLAERDFVQKVEAALSPGSMVYQYPYSQYLRDNKYYGWGSFSHIRLYLHSHNLRWSNGGAKNSPADDWNYRVSQLPLSKIISEIESVGFAALVIDRTVLSSEEYQSIRTYLSGRGYDMNEDNASRFTFVRLRDPGYRLTYDMKYQKIEQLVVTDTMQLSASDFSSLVEGDILKKLVSNMQTPNEHVFRNADYPNLFVDHSVFLRGTGQFKIDPISDVKGTLSCKLNDSDRTLVLNLENKSKFHWKLGEGTFPIRIGMHIRNQQGNILRFDDGFRVKSNAYILRGTSATIPVSYDALPSVSGQKEGVPLIAEFVLLQDGNAWFGNINCLVPRG